MNLEAIINDAHEQRATISPSTASSDVRAAVEQVIDQLDAGTLRVAEKRDGQWIVNQWVKKAVLLSFRLNDNVPVQGGFGQFYLASLRDPSGNKRCARHRVV